ncbi:MAG: hypothetical protein KatS3mg031_2667 [Chitinophagales bacterium]|nr:MAG: hypothetical protein KatS3mg031_2667 [Chitinophagales bacterium]
MKLIYFRSMLKTKNPAFKDYVQLKVARNAFLKAIGFELTEIEVGRVTGILLFRKMHEQQNGFVHGGVISTLCDMACGYAAYTLVAEGEQVFTAELKVSYLRKGSGNRLVAKGWVLKAGHHFHFCEAEIYAENEEGVRLIAKASSTMAVVRGKVNDKYGD